MERVRLCMCESVRESVRMRMRMSRAMALLSQRQTKTTGRLRISVGRLDGLMKGAILALMPTGQMG